MVEQLVILIILFLSLHLISSGQKSRLFFVITRVNKTKPYLKKAEEIFRNKTGPIEGTRLTFSSDHRAAEREKKLK